MKYLFLHNLLLALPVKGFLWSATLLLLCFFGIHFLQLAKRGWDAYKKPTSPQSQEKEPSAKPAQEPIYYIVERKTRRAKSSYGEPKKINFKP